MNNIEEYQTITDDITNPSLGLAKVITSRANAAWEDGSFLELVTPTTRTLLKYWFDDAYTEMRNVNFHVGQRQAILNLIYVHEILKKDKVIDVYTALAPNLLAEREFNIDQLHDEIYNLPKYCVKMATGTGKTWVFEALIIWQYLNAHHEEAGNFTKNFLVIAPGIIVYERLLDAFLGKVADDGVRDFETCDVKVQEDLFLPEEYRNEFYGFLQSSVVAKKEIGSKVTGDGLIAVTNQHLLMGAGEQEKDQPGIEDGWRLPVSPGKAAGNSLDVLDNSLDGKKELEYLHRLSDLMMINDEAHHIHDSAKAGEKDEVEWQKALRYIASGKGNRAIQVDFSATPYAQKGKRKIYFPHIIVDFNLKEAINDGLVKMIWINERKELAVQELDFRAKRSESGTVIDLSDGQRQMIRAGLAKLRNLEAEFEKIDPEKKPKMLIMCEDTNVVPFVADFLRLEGLDNDDFLEIHSNKQGEVGEEEWEKIRHKLFSLDRHKKPSVVVSVLMLREGFDVNNVCVIVPLRSTDSQILLEQTIGRGLRLMWRNNPEIDELKAENRQAMRQHKSATNYFDVLSIVEHPAFREFYDELINEGLMGEENEDISQVKLRGDLEIVGLKDNYEEYDFYLPCIISEAGQKMKPIKIDISRLEPTRMSYDALVKIVPERETWIEKEVLNGVNAGYYEVTTGIFRSSSYNDYIGRLTNLVVEKLNSPLDRIGRSRSSTSFPGLTINQVEIAAAIDGYIRHRLFNQEFDPAEGNNWKILLLDDVMNHVKGQLVNQIIKLQEENEILGDAKVIFTPFSSVDKIAVREEYCIEPIKCIYEKCPFPSNKGIFERNFMDFCDHDGEVDAFCKIIENRHTFARFRYIRDDGMPAEYIPDFVVRIGNDNYLVETKAQNQLSNPNVVRKKRSAVRRVNKINALPDNIRQGIAWHYAMLDDKMFYDWKKKNATIKDMLEYAELKNDVTDFSGRLF